MAVDGWQAARGYLRDTGDRFAELVSDGPVAGKRATVHWSVAETAAHVASLSRICRTMADPDCSGALHGDLVRETVVDTVDRLNAVLLDRYPERDPRRLAESVRADIDAILRATGGADPRTAIPWLGGSSVPLDGLLAHLLNELQIHGRDIARATGRPWRVPPEEAAPFIDLFLVGVTRYGYGRLLEGHGPAPAGRVAVEFRSRYTTPFTMAMTDGFVRVEEPGGPTDVRLSFDPTTLNLMLFGRVSRARAALTGKVVVRGRRPWKLPGFLRIVRLPS